MILKDILLLIYKAVMKWIYLGLVLCCEARADATVMFLFV